MENILRLISGKTFNIEPNFGMSVLNEVQALQSMDLDLMTYYDKLKEKSTQIEVYSKDYTYASNFNDDIKPGSIAKVSISGMMLEHDGLCHYGMNHYDNLFRQLYAD